METGVLTNGPDPVILLIRREKKPPDCRAASRGVFFVPYLGHFPAGAGNLPAPECPDLGRKRGQDEKKRAEWGNIPARTRSRFLGQIFQHPATVTTVSF
jgi:hypothetical protein